MEEEKKHESPHPSHVTHHKKDDDEEGSVNITLKKSSLWKIGTFVFAALFIASLYSGGFGLGDSNGGTGTGSAIAPTAPAPSGAAPTPGKIGVQITDADPILGSPDAQLSIVEFSDFQCPFCQRVDSGALADLRNSEYFKDGTVNLVYKHFPLSSIHPFAQKAGEASECARRIGGNDKFWEYHDTLFANAPTLDDDSLKSYASQIGLDSGEFNSCLDGDEAKSKVDSDLQEASSAGGRGTPYFVVINNENGNTQAISGAVPWSQFEAAINSLL